MGEPSIQIGWKCKCGHSFCHDYEQGYLHLVPIDISKYPDFPTKPIPPSEFFKAQKQCPHCDCKSPEFAGDK